ncbi:MAG: biotin--[acetyl-CoA-carboxylase] ligase [Anaerolineae bacterium]|nr:biotin--[acetyl-CoA-carboxylase] ligase [Anaerolineae bacterium]MDW7991329.1 biotin--[acetyl-CoA-carboxylase] ligase [Anaerolineae bacterium]
MGSVHTFGDPLIRLLSTTSTNDVARDLARQGAPEGTVVVADYQTAGRGRMGRRWLAPPGTSLLCSLLFRPHPEHARDLPFLCALAAADAVEKVAGLSVALKWPNDLIVVRGEGWRKLGGILAETEVSGGQVEFVVVGIGINVNVPPEVLPSLSPEATSILAETGRETDREQLLIALLEQTDLLYRQLRAGQRPFAQWVTRLATLGQEVRLSTVEGEWCGIAEAVDEEGALLLRTPDGALRRVLVGDVLRAH